MYCAGLVKGSRDEYIGNLSSFIGVQNSLYVDIMGDVIAIEVVWFVSI